MNKLRIDHHFTILSLLALLSCGWLTGCCTPIVKDYSSIHEVMTPQSVMADEKGNMILKISCAYYGSEQFSDRKSKPLSEFAPRGRFLMLNSKWINGRIYPNVKAGNTVPIDNIIYEAPTDQLRVIPNGFLDPGLESYRKEDVHQYRLDQPVPYQTQKGLIYTSPRRGFFQRGLKCAGGLFPPWRRPLSLMLV